MPDAVSSEVMRREGLTVAFALVQQPPLRTWWPSLPHRLPKHTFGNTGDSYLLAVTMFAGATDGHGPHC